MDDKAQQKYRGMNDHDLLITLAVSVEEIKQELVGNGKTGLCTRVDNVETVQTKHGVYFAILATAVAIGVPLITWLYDKIGGG